MKLSNESINEALTEIEEIIEHTHALILSKPHLRDLIDTNHGIPEIYNGGGKIKLIVIGQDPTIRNKASRKNITTVLNLDKPGKLQRYIFGICESLSIDPNTELYATNLFKNFFEETPDYADNNLYKFFDYWFPVLQKEMYRLPDVPVMFLGDNVLEFLTLKGVDKHVRNYWGYTDNWHETGGNGTMKHIYPHENLLNKIVFPFPQQPSIIKEFYASRLTAYTDFIKHIINLTKVF